jgi:Zn-dependent peptidase ImmA (M78 family)
MNDDFLVPPKSAKEIETKALDWRHALGVDDVWSPDVIDLFENKLPKVFPSYTLAVRSDQEMIALDDAEAYTAFNPPVIAVRNSVYILASQFDGRARMTFAHEFGHLVLHPGAAKLRAETASELLKRPKPFVSAEWQARKFAAYFLLPEHVVRQFSTPRDLAEACHVSFQAAEIRFQEVGHVRRLTPQCVTDLIRDVNKAAPQFPKPTLVK